jgi:hypothetical protein
VFPAEAQTFACDAPITTQTLTNLACVSAQQVSSSCLGTSMDRADYVFDVPADCASVAVEIRIAYPLAFADVDVSLVSDADGSAVGAETSCVGASGGGETSRCIDANVTAGDRYHVYVNLSSDGSGDCGGDCEYNRYTLSFQLALP